MKTLIVYYSRTGLTKKVAESISKKIKADVDIIIDKKDRSGPIGYIKAGRDAMKNRLTTIEYSKNPKDYDLIIIGGPVWGWTVAPAVRTYIDQNVDALKIIKLAFFATQGNSGAEKKFEAMSKILETKPVATLIVNGKDFRENLYEEKIDTFLKSADTSLKSISK
jgi:flavodoxin